MAVACPAARQGSQSVYRNFFKLREKPFSMLPDPAFLYLSRQHQRALSLLRYGIFDQVGFTVLTGEVGCGKTTLLRRLMMELDKRVTVGLVSNTQCENFQELLQWTLLTFGLAYRDKDKVSLYEDFTDFLVREHAAGRRTVLCIDEAQHLDTRALEQLRMLSNVNADKHQLLQLVLVGQPSLWQRLARPELEQFVQRIGVDYHLKPLDQVETANYIRHRLTVAGGAPDLFSSETIVAIWRYTKGIPRLVNLLCDTTLVYAYAEQSPTVTRALLEDVVQDKRQGLSRLWAGVAPTEQDFDVLAMAGDKPVRPLPLNDGGKAV